MSTAYTYLTLGSWERDVGRAEKQKRTFFLSQPFLIHSSFSQIHLYTYVLCVCAVCCAEGRDMPTLSRMRFSTEKTPFIERYFFASKNSFSLMRIRYKNNLILASDCEASTILRKSKLFPLVRAVLSRNLVHAAAAVAQRYPRALLWLPVDFSVRC